MSRKRRSLDGRRSGSQGNLLDSLAMSTNANPSPNPGPVPLSHDWTYYLDDPLSTIDTQPNHHALMQSKRLFSFNLPLTDQQLMIEELSRRASMNETTASRDKIPLDNVNESPRQLHQRGIPALGEWESMSGLGNPVRPAVPASQPTRSATVPRPEAQVGLTDFDEPHEGSGPFNYSEHGSENGLLKPAAIQLHALESTQSHVGHHDHEPGHVHDHNCHHHQHHPVDAHEDPHHHLGRHVIMIISFFTKVVPMISKRGVSEAHWKSYFRESGHCLQ